MDHVNIRINLRAFAGAFRTRLKGLSSEKEFVCIPVDDNDIFVGKSGDYVNLIGVRVNNLRDGKTHLIKPRFSPEKYRNMEMSEKKNIPVVGDIAPVKWKNDRAKSEDDGFCENDEGPGDYPF